MKVLKTGIKDLVVLEPTVWGDERGYFFESFSDLEMKAHGLDYTWVQDNEAFSKRGVLRGLHYQKAPHGQAKLVRVAYGEVLDVVVDIRIGSATYGKKFSVILSGKNKKQLLIPRGFAHGYCVLSEEALFLYKVDNAYKKEEEFGLAYNDKDLKIDWIIKPQDLIVSEKDQTQRGLKDFEPYEQS